VPDGITAAAVERVMGATRDALLVGVDLQSEYRGGSVPPGHRSVTWRLTFRHPERTLREKEVEARRDKLLRALESELGVRQRTA
jgi:phenylalanyl-tRNA synthetase beta chain